MDPRIIQVKIILFGLNTNQQKYKKWDCKVETFITCCVIHYRSRAYYASGVSEQRLRQRKRGYVTSLFPG